MFRRPRRVYLALPALLLVAATAACSGGGKPDDASASSGSAGDVATTPRIKIAMISHAPAGDAFFDTIINGAKSAVGQGQRRLPVLRGR